MANENYSHCTCSDVGYVPAAGGARRLSETALLDEGVRTCWYARCEKHWVMDPQGIAWERFQTLQNVPAFSESKETGPSAAAQVAACCLPRGKTVGVR